MLIRPSCDDGVEPLGCATALTAATAAATPAADDDDDDIWDVAIAPESGSFATASTTLKPLNALCARHATDVGLSVRRQ